MTTTAEETEKLPDVAATAPKVQGVVVSAAFCAERKVLTARKMGLASVVCVRESALPSQSSGQVSAAPLTRLDRAASRALRSGNVQQSIGLHTRDTRACTLRRQLLGCARNAPQALRQCPPLRSWR